LKRAGNHGLLAAIQRVARVSPSSERTVNFGVIGTGRIAADFARDLKLVRNTALHAVLSREVTSAEAFQKANGAARAYASLAAFLADPDIDAVYVASPNSVHLEQALAVIRAGKAALIEKPLAASSSEAESIRAEAALSGTFAMEAMWIRFLPGIQRARALIASGAVGEVKAVRGELSYLHAYDPNSRLFNKALGGGASLDLGVYLLSLTTFLFGLPRSISGEWKAAASGVDSVARYALSYDGFQAELTTSLEHDGHNVFEIEGTAGALRIEDPFIQARRLRLLTGAAAGAPLLRPAPSRKPGSLQKLLARLPLPGQKIMAFDYLGNGLQFEAQAMADAVRAGTSGSSLAPLNDSIAVLKMIETVLSRPAAMA
jgi:predicted dehydrogenase